MKLHRIVSLKSFCLLINGKQNATFHFAEVLISNKMHEATLKLYLKDSMLIAHTELLLQIMNG